MLPEECQSAFQDIVAAISEVGPARGSWAFGFACRKAFGTTSGPRAGSGPFARGASGGSSGGRSGGRSSGPADSVAEPLGGSFGPRAAIAEAAIRRSRGAKDALGTSIANVRACAGALCQ